MTTFIRRMYAWLTLADYDEASEAATELVIKRYTRGNVSLQNGWYLNERDLTKLSEQGDKAAARIRAAIAAMREPTDAMVGEMQDSHDGGPRAVYRAAIDEALK